ncbi:Acetylcholinesterase [Armadillidium vulgare]|nr:Acetylcholinesterase [Armadillidium vulgare]
MMIGINKEDGSHISNSLFMSEGRRMALKHHFPLVGPISLEFSDEDVAPLNMSIKAYDRYIGNLDVDAPDALNLTKMYTDRHYGVCSDLTAEYHSINNQKYKRDVYFYVFEHRGERSTGDAFGLNIGNDWVSHGDELYYLFPFNKTKEHFRSEEDAKMKKLFIRLWHAFAEHGNPTPGEAFDFTWSPYTAENRTHLRLNLEPSMEEDTMSEQREFWTTLPTQQNIYLNKEYFVKKLNITKEDKGEKSVKEDKDDLKEEEEKKKEEGRKEEEESATRREKKEGEEKADKDETEDLKKEEL